MKAQLQSLLVQGDAARCERRLAEAKGCFSEAVSLAQASADAALLVQSLKRLGGIERDLGEIDRSLGHYRQAVELSRRIGDPLLRAHTVRHVGDILRESSQLEPALPCYEEALAIYRENTQTNLLDLANTLRGFALLDAAQDRNDAAIAKWREAGELYDRVWRLPDSPYAEADLAPGVAESKRQIALLSGI
jgi:tetratricopeptide (TPR) repeat protein